MRAVMLTGGRAANELYVQPKYYDTLLGRRVNQAVKRGTAVDWDLILDLHAVQK